jgi:hypothetical protein
MSLLFRVVAVLVARLRRFVGWFCCLIGVSCLGAFAFVIVIAFPTWVRLFTSLAELSSHPSPPLTGQVSNLAIQSVCDLPHTAAPSLAPSLPLFQRNQVELRDQRGGFALNGDRKILSEKSRTSAKQPDVPLQSIQIRRDICTVRDAVRVSEAQQYAA